MKKREELFKKDIGSFDTPKKINRSSKSIQAEILDSLESGTFTYEMLMELKKTFPVFYYRTCITIHGAWPSVRRQYIGSYKNVIQNQNGSLELRHTAIDVAKKEELKKWIYLLQGTILPFKFSYHKDSTGDSFQAIIDYNRKDEVVPFIKEMRERLSKVKSLYGGISASVFNFYGSLMIVCVFSPYAFAGKDMDNILCALSGFDKDHITVLKKQALKQQEEARAKREKEEAEAKARAEAIREEADKLLQPLHKKIVSFAKVSAKDIPEYACYPRCVNKVAEFVIVQFTKRSFGRYTIAYDDAGNSEPTLPTNPVWKGNGKYYKLSELLQKYSKVNLRALPNKVSKKEPARVVTKKAKIEPTQTSGVSVVSYSDKALAVFGDTKPIKDSLKEIGARFNMALTNPETGTKQPGWILPKSKEAELNKVLL
jgi:hypothetical protein